MPLADIASCSEGCQGSTDIFALLLLLVWLLLLCAGNMNRLLLYMLAGCADTDRAPPHSLLGP